MSMFQNLTYNQEKICCNERPIPVLLIVTSGYPNDHYEELIKNYQTVFNGFVGPTEVFVSGDTLQIKDYSKTDWPWSVVDPQAKYQRHDLVFPQECKTAFDLGASLLKPVG